MNVVLLGNYEGSKLAAENRGIAIVVDTLRASTTMPIAMNKGIRELYVALEVEDARLAAKKFKGLLMGERGCIPLEGFDFGNSPVVLHHTKKIRKTIAAFTSTTGAKRVVEAIGSQVIIIGSPINAKAVVTQVSNLKQSSEFDDVPVVIIPAFTEGVITENEVTEDQVGGLLIAREFKKAGYELSNETEEELFYLSKLLEKASLEEILAKTKHGQNLIALNLEEDIAFCSKLNAISDVPVSMNKIQVLENGSRVVKLEHFIAK